MSLLAERAGQVVIRVGGNTQDYATLVDSTSDGKMIEKQSIDPNNPVRPFQALSEPCLDSCILRPQDWNTNVDLHG